MIRNPEANPVALSLLKSSVAAHQAGCFCHPETECPNEHVSDCKEYEYGKDSTGMMWHLDPQCKVRPEAGA